MAEITITNCNGEPVELDPAPELDDKVADVRIRVASHLNCQVSDLVLYHDGEILADDAAMREYESFSILALITDNLQDKIQQVLVDSGAVLGAIVVSRESGAVVAAAGVEVLAAETYKKSVLQEDGETNREVTVDELAGLLELVSTGKKPAQGIWFSQQKYLLVSHDSSFRVGRDAQLIAVVLQTLGGKPGLGAGRAGISIMSTAMTIFLAVYGGEEKAGSCRVALGAFAADRLRRGD
eukprot:TRINITY_DN103413_c0_g1_i1.p1 TRINITY_DN103413_c0_g1~~TRINITY_DN103413_c0_g1_i1.p1  ORF type:complete len:238 (+),score=41.52 TRINITY_DN103413_c0_g1_i1:80-793(+)